jgi:hypothetical protein
MNKIKTKEEILEEVCKHNIKSMHSFVSTAQAVLKAMKIFGDQEYERGWKNGKEATEDVLAGYWDV